MKFVFIAAGLVLLLRNQVCAAIPVLAPASLKGCVNFNVAVGGPVGFIKGNTANKFAHLSFYLLDPSAGNNTWTAGEGARIDIRLSVPSPVAAYLVLNTIWGQPSIPNAAVTFIGASGRGYTQQLIGGTQIRDDNNDSGVNTINETTTQEWWTNNPDPKPDDQTKREDVHGVDLSMFAGDTLTHIIVSAPADAAQYYMQPLLYAVSVDTGTGAHRIASSCVAGQN